MNDPRIGTLALIVVLYIVIALIEGIFTGLTKTVSGKGPALLLVLFAIPFTILNAVLIGFAGSLMYGIVQPAFGWPKVDLIVMIALVWFAGLLTRGAVPQRVRIVEEFGHD